MGFDSGECFLKQASRLGFDSDKVTSEEMFGMVFHFFFGFCDFL